MQARKPSVVGEQDGVDVARIDPLEDEIVPVGAAAEAAGLVPRQQRIPLGMSARVRHRASNSATKSAERAGLSRPI